MKCTQSVPEVGQLVEVRRRQWVTKEVTPSRIGTQHLILLTSIDEDSFDEEISVVWEIEPGARVIESAGLPNFDGYDDAERLEAFLDGIRWGATVNVDKSHIQAPFRSGIEIQDYQLDPLARAINMARANLLIADDVGLGKTIEAGLIIQEFVIRHRARSVLIVCPSSLQQKWKEEMWSRFGLPFKIVDADYLRSLRRSSGIHVNPWTSYPRLITSMDWAKSGEGLRALRDILPPYPTFPRKFDILVVDEAHNVAPATATRYSLDSQRTKLIRKLAPHFEHKLFLSATPNNGYRSSFTALMELLDNQRFSRGIMPSEKLRDNVIVRRLKPSITDKDGKPIYPKRVLNALEVHYSKSEKEIHQIFKEYCESREKLSQASHSNGVTFVHKLLKKRLFSSPLAFAMTLNRHRERLANPTGTNEAKKKKDNILQRAIAKAEEDYANDECYEVAMEEAVEVASHSSPPLTEEQQVMLNRLHEWAEKSKNKIDSKAKAILDWLEAHLKTNGEWNDNRVILFTEYRATHSWLYQILVAHDWGGERLCQIHGGIDEKEREQVKAAFQANADETKVRILLATDAASEGIDLQRNCNYLIHLEIPWNPNVMEQRNGRIDRHGQKAPEVHIWHPVAVPPKDITREILNPGDLYGDLEHLFRAAQKVNQIREDLGCMGPILNKQIEELMLGKRSEINTRDSESLLEKSRKSLRAETNLKEKIAKLHQGVLDARHDLNMSPQNVKRAVDVALQLDKKPPLKEIEDPHRQGNKLYEVPALSGSWSEACNGLEHPHTGRKRPITFDHSVIENRDDIVLVHLQHKLVAKALRLLRAEVWMSDDTRRLNRISLHTIPDSVSLDPIIVCWSRLVVTGSTQHRLHEEITFSGGRLRDKSYARLSTQEEIKSVIDASAPLEPSDELWEALKHRYESNKSSVLQTVEARSKDRLKFLLNRIKRRCDNETETLNNILSDLESSLKRELGEEKNTQFRLDEVSDDFKIPEKEHDQLVRDEQAMRDRLMKIPDEREKEKAIILDRYSNPTDRTFPVALQVFVPASFVEKHK